MGFNLPTKEDYQPNYFTMIESISMVIVHKIFALPLYLKKVRKPPLSPIDCEKSVKKEVLSIRVAEMVLLFRLGLRPWMSEAEIGPFGLIYLTFSL